MELTSKNGFQVLKLINNADNVKYTLPPSVDQIADVSDFDVSNRFRANSANCFYLFGVDNPNLLRTITGWWWGKTKNSIGYVNRPLGRQVCENMIITNSLEKT